MSGTDPSLYGAGDWIRTRDLLITNQLLYQLSYTSEVDIIQKSTFLYKSNMINDNGINIFNVYPII